MKPSQIIFALFILAQISLFAIATAENIVAFDEVVGITAIVVVFLALFFFGQRWARWVVLVVLFLIMLMIGSMTFEGESVGFICVAFIYAALIVMIFRYRFPANESVVASETPDTPYHLPPVQDGFYVGQKVYRYPLLVKRYQSLFIDTLFWLFLMVVVMVILGESEWRSVVMISLLAIATFLYEPLLTVYSSTLGQRVMGIKVRKFSDPEQRISLSDAYARAIVKLL